MRALGAFRHRGYRNTSKVQPPDDSRQPARCSASADSKEGTQGYRLHVRLGAAFLRPCAIEISLANGHPNVLCVLTLAYDEAA